MNAWPMPRLSRPSRSSSRRRSWSSRAAAARPSERAFQVGQPRRGRGFRPLIIPPSPARRRSAARSLCVLEVPHFFVHENRRRPVNKGRSGDLRLAGSENSASAARCQALVAASCAVQVRPIPGALRLGAGCALRLASRGFGNREIAVTPCRFAVRAPCAGRVACFRESAALSRRFSRARSAYARSGAGVKTLVAEAAWLASAARSRRGAFVPRRPASASASPCGLGGVCAPSQLSLRLSRPLRAPRP